MANYFIIGGDNKEYGPVTEADVRQWIAEGRLNGQSRVKAESDAEFRPLALFPELAAALQAQSAPATIAPLNHAREDNNGPEDVLTREPELKLGECLAAGSSFLGANAGFLLGAVLFTSMMNVILLGISLSVPLLGPLAMVSLNGVVMGGFYLACLRRLRGEDVPPTAVFSGFTRSFPQLLLVGLVSALLTEFSFCCFVLPAIYLAVAWAFSVLLVADKQLFFWAAMELSRKVVTRVWFEVCLLLVITFIPLLLFQVYSMVQVGSFFWGLYDQAGQNWQQFAQSLTEHPEKMEDFKKASLLSAAIGQGILLLNLLYCAGVITRAYENLFGPRKP